MLGVNIGCNAIPFGADVTGLLPRIFTIIRGQIFCGVVSLAMVPWKLLTNGSGFLTFLGSYNIFISPICGIIIVDYFVLKRGNIHTLSLFDPSKGSLYFYKKGVNFTAVAAWISGAAFGIPGLIGSYHPTWVAEAATHIYQTGWIVCIAVSMTLYFLFNLIAKPRIFPNGFESDEKRFEMLAENKGYLEGENMINFHISRYEGQRAENSETRSPEAVSIQETFKSEF